VRVLTSRGDDLTDSDDEMRVAMRQIAGVFSQLEKTRLVKKLKAARERKRLSGDPRWTGRKPLAVLYPEAVAMAKRLHRASPKTGERRSLRKIAHELAAAGHVNASGREFNPASIKAMIDGPIPKRHGS
jgi:DNA invertase Pin-like site-specific DNA recombinase